MDGQYIAQLVYNLQCGDQQAFEELYNQTNKMVYFICKNLLNSDEDAKDVMQDVYITAYFKIGQLNEREKFQAWVNQIAVNKCKNHMAKNKPMILDPEEFNETILEENENFLPEEYIVEKEKRKIVMDIMRKSLSEIQYNTVILYYFNGLSIYEIADIMECPPGTVSYRLSVARAKIKEGVLLYENKTEDKLYSTAAIPFLASLFAAEAGGMVVPDVLPQIMTAISGAAASVISGVAGAAPVGDMAAQMGGMTQIGATTQMGNMATQIGTMTESMPGVASSQVGGMVTGAATTAAKTGVAALKTKIALGVAAATLVGGGVALVLHLNNKDEDSHSKKETTEYSIETTEDIYETITEEIVDSSTEASTEEEIVNVYSGSLTPADVGYNKTSDALYLDDMLSLRFTMDGVSYNFPIDYSDFIQGWEYVDESMKEEINEEIEYKESIKSSDFESAYTSGFWITNPKYDENLQVRVNVSNYSKEPVKAMDGTINSLYVSIENCSSYPEMTFPGDIRFGSSFDSVVDAYGTDGFVSMTEFTNHNTYSIEYRYDSEDLKEEHNGNYEEFERGVNVVFYFNNEKELTGVGFFMNPTKFYTDRVLLNEYIASEVDFSTMTYDEAYEYLNTLPTTYERKFLSSTDGMPEGECMITGFLRDDEIIIIPDTINGNKVTAIHTSAMNNLENTLAIKVPETVTRLEDRAFMEVFTVQVICGLENVETLGSLSLYVGGDDSSGEEVKTKIRLNSFQYATKDGEKEEDEGVPFSFGNLIIYAPAGSDSYNNLLPYVSVIGDDIIVEAY